MPEALSGEVQVHYRVEGVGPPLVLHHGFMDSLESWVEYGYVEALRPTHQLVLIDGRGHGASGKPHDPAAYAARHQAEDVVAVLDDLGIPVADYFGYSMGGVIGFALAKYAPDRAGRYVIGGASPYGMPQEIVLDTWRGLKEGPEAAAALWEAQGTISPQLRNRLCSNDMDALRAFFRSGTVVPDPMDEIPKGLHAPCLCIVGKDDWALDGVVKTVEQLPDGRLVRLPGLNHLQAFQRSDLVVPHVQKFLVETTA